MRHVFPCFSLFLLFFSVFLPFFHFPLLLAEEALRRTQDWTVRASYIVPGLSSVRSVKRACKAECYVMFFALHLIGHWFGKEGFSRSKQHALLL